MIVAPEHCHTCPGCLGTCMSIRDDGEGGPERCEACAGEGFWTAEEMAEHLRRMESLDRSIAMTKINDGPF